MGITIAWSTDGFQQGKIYQNQFLNYRGKWFRGSFQVIRELTFEEFVSRYEQEFQKQAPDSKGPHPQARYYEISID